MSSGPTERNETADQRRYGGEEGADTSVNAGGVKAPGTCLCFTPSVASAASQRLSYGGRMTEWNRKRSRWQN